MISQEDLIERAWSLVEEALTKGTLTLESTNEKANSRILETEDIIDLAKFLATIKIKKPQLINTPEDFSLKTTGEGADEEL